MRPSQPSPRGLTSHYKDQEKLQDYVQTHYHKIHSKSTVSLCLIIIKVLVKLQVGAWRKVPTMLEGLF
jgi:hypothetical protein